MSMAERALNTEGNVFRLENKINLSWKNKIENSMMSKGKLRAEEVQNPKTAKPFLLTFILNGLTSTLLDTCISIYLIINSPLLGSA